MSAGTNPTGCDEYDPRITRVAAVGVEALQRLFSPDGLAVVEVGEGEKIPGSFWGEPEAGLIQHTLYLRADTPIHSALHEGCHYLCMPPHKREQLHTNVGGTQAEEDATCYLQLLLAEQLPQVGRALMCHDMDLWGYSFRLGSAQAWFERDAQEAKQWLVARGLYARAVGSPDAGITSSA